MTTQGDLVKVYGKRSYVRGDIFQSTKDLNINALATLLCDKLREQNTYKEVIITKEHFIKKVQKQGDQHVRTK